jgi:predicted dehydrogenase
MRRSGIPGLGSWFTNKQLAGGGPLIDLGVHILDLSLWFLGEPAVHSITASTYSELGPRGRGGWPGSAKSGAGNTYSVEDLATAFIRLAGGATLLLETSWATYSEAGDDFGITLYGTEGGAKIDVRNYGWERTLRVFNDVGGIPSDSTPRVMRGEGHLGVVREFVRRIHTGEDQLLGGIEGLHRTQIIDACYASAIEGREIVLNEGTSGDGQ